MASPADFSSSSPFGLGATAETVVPAHAGLPALEVLFTASTAEADKFLAGVQGCTHLGLDMEWRPNFNPGSAPSVSALLQLAAGRRVLIIDLHARRRKKNPLPRCVQAFLQDEERVVYGMGLINDLARLTFEFDCVARGVDFRVRAWPGIDLTGGGLSGLGNRLLGTSLCQSKTLTKSNWEARPLSQRQLQYLAEDAYVSWAIADHFLTRHKAPVDPGWLISQVEMYRVASRLIQAGLPVRHFARDWSAVEEEAARVACAEQREKATKRKRRMNKKREQNRQQLQQKEGTATEDAGEQAEVGVYSTPRKARRVSPIVAA